MIDQKNKVLIYKGLFVAVEYLHEGIFTTTTARLHSIELNRASLIDSMVTLKKFTPSQEAMFLMNLAKCEFKTVEVKILK